MKFKGQLNDDKNEISGKCENADGSGEFYLKKILKETEKPVEDAMQPQEQLIKPHYATWSGTCVQYGKQQQWAIKMLYLDSEVLEADARDPNMGEWTMRGKLCERTILFSQTYFDR